MRVKVRCVLEVEIEVNEEACDTTVFRIEENGCPGTGPVGAAIMQEIERSEGASVCWACNMGGTNKVIEIDGEPII